MPGDPGWAPGVPGAVRAAGDADRVPLPGGHLPDGFWDVDEHERERGHREPRVPAARQADRLVEGRGGRPDEVRLLLRAERPCPR